MDLTKKEKLEEIQKITKEKTEKITSLEKNRLLELNKKEDEYKIKLDKLKLELNQRNDMNENLKEEYNVYKTQMEMLEKNFENFKISKKEQE